MKLEPIPAANARSQVNRWFMMTRGANCIASLVQEDYTKYHADFNIPTSSSPDAMHMATSDHTFEKSWLKDFFVEILDDTAATVQGVSTGTQDKINCLDFDYYTDDSTIATDPNLLSDVFKAYPSNSKYLDDLIGMDAFINSQAKVIRSSPFPP